MIVHGYRKNPLGPFLANDVLIQESLDVGRRRHLQRTLDGTPRTIFCYQVRTEIHALIADVRIIRSGNELGRFILAFPAEGACRHFRAVVWRHDYLLN
jgi:hypothetical protein